MSNYIAYYFKVEPPQPGTDILIASLGDAGFESFVENEEGFEAYISEELEKNVNLNEFTFVILVLDFNIRERSKAAWAPVDDAFGAIDKPLIKELLEDC
mgnify:CR=1 FL=1